MSDLLSILRGNELLADLDDPTLSLLADTASWKELGAGEVLFREGSPRAAVYLVVEGTLEIVRRRGERMEQLILLGPGQAVGESALLHEAEHTATARAAGPTRLLVLPREKVLAKLRRDAGAALGLLTQVARTVNRRLQFAGQADIGRAPSHRSGAVREEHDLLGDRQVPADARYGIQTLRAVENFPITGIRLSHYPGLVRALAAVKQAAVRANARLELIDPEIADAIDRACREILDGHWHGHFVVDMVQGGAGTSTNMNANEVIANRALELLGRRPGEYGHCHPNNHVNLSQSTNDVYPTAIRLAALDSVRDLVSSLERLRSALAERGEAFRDVIKMGRTQLQDAVPMTLGQEFTALAVTTGEDVDRLRETARLFLEINLGGTAIGTGINADPAYPRAVIEELRRITGRDLVPAENLVEATPDTGAFVAFSGVLKRIAVKLSKLCNDLRLLSSGPRCGLNEIDLPAMQPGSSIMPGKVNPVIPEVVNQVAFQVVGNDLTITLAAEAGQLQLNVMEPIIAFNLFQSMEMLTSAVDVLTGRCITGIRANRERCREQVERSIGLVTALVPAIGYEKAGEAAREALESDRAVREVILEKGWLTPKELDDLLSPESMLRPRMMGRGDRP